MFKKEFFYSKFTRTFLFMLVLTALAILLVSCAGKEVIGIDTTPPEKTILVPHKGDTGDLIRVDGVLLNDENNGIDAVPDNDWIRLEWKPIFDPDVDYLKLFRFGDYSELAQVDSLSRSQWMRNEYIDKKLHLEGAVGQEWSYYVETYDQFGNFAVSDTVSYKLIEKTQLVSPPNNHQASIKEPIVFEWMRTEDALHHRVIVFDSDYHYMWHEDYYIVEDSDYTLEYTGPDLTGYDMIIWRVDSFGDLEDPLGVSLSGSESRERVIYLTQ
ncbi:MAG: hypothetical protein WCX83_06165 [Candidatus Cloacimonas sp.]|jgi:hypothetical protein|nr:hypothetical protein [Candidatus Cloacimonadota bacterium]